MRLTLPTAPGPSPRWELPLVLVVCATATILRAGDPLRRGFVWAEDGGVFLQHAYESSQVGFTVPYAGYLHALPRLIASLVEPFPLAWHGVLVCLSAALVQALLATFAYQVVRAHAPGRIAACLCAASVVGVPVGPETVGNIANLQWFLLLAGCLAPLSRSRTRAGWAAAALVLLATATSSPFGAVPVGVAGVVWFLTRHRASLLLFLTGAAGVLLQVYGILTAPPRVAPVGPATGVGAVFEGYVTRVLGDSVLGWHRHGDALETRSTSLTAGLLVLAVVVALVAVLWRRGGPGQVGLPLLLLGLSVVLWLPPALIARPDQSFVVVAGRYHVAPALLLLTACAVLVERAWLTRSPGRRTTEGVRVASAGLAGALVLAMAYGQVTTWEPTATFFRRNASVPWADQVRQEKSCATNPTGAAVIETDPPGWSVRVPCRLFDRRAVGSAGA